MRGTEFPGRTYVPFSPRRRSGLISRAHLPLFQSNPVQSTTLDAELSIRRLGTTTTYPTFSFTLTAAHRAHFIKSTFSPWSRKETLSRSGGSEASSPSADGLEHPPLILVRSFPRLPITLAFSKSLFSLTRTLPGPLLPNKAILTGVHSTHPEKPSQLRET